MRVLVPMDIDLTEDQQKEVTLKYLYKLYDWKSTYFLYEENVCNIVTYHSHKTWRESVVVRAATDDDYVFSSLLIKIKDNK